eukprot:1226589-Rhodomonas_salina.3
MGVLDVEDGNLLAAGSCIQKKRRSGELVNLRTYTREFLLLPRACSTYLKLASPAHLSVSNSLLLLLSCSSGSKTLPKS